MRLLWLEYDDTENGPILQLLTDATGAWRVVEGTTVHVGSWAYVFAKATGMAPFQGPGSECRWLDLRGKDHHEALAKGGDHLWELVPPSTG